MIEVGKRGYVLFDGDCGICTYLSEWAKNIDVKHLFVVEPYQRFPEEELIRLGITYEQCAKKMQVVSRQGRVYAGAFGVNYFLVHYFPWSLLVVLVYAVPPLLLLEYLGYAWVAKNRHRLSQWFGLKACLLKR